jgi:hypothetical protein
MKKLFNLILFIVICLLVYIVFRSSNTMEGLESAIKNIKKKTGGAVDYDIRLTNGYINNKG